MISCFDHRSLRFVLAPTRLKFFVNLDFLINRISSAHDECNAYRKIERIILKKDVQKKKKNLYREEHMKLWHRYF